MKKQDLVRLFAVSAAAVPGLLLSASIASAQVISSDGFPASVPKAICGPGDHTESGLQGETSLQERFSGDSERAYNCNLELVGEEPQDTYQGAYSQDGPAWYDVCTYYGTDRGFTTGQGIKVIDASDPAHPVVVTQLTDTPAALDPHETVATNAKTRLLVAGQTNGPNFAVYDISDCRHPVLKGTVNASSTSFHHMGAFAPDGKTYYASQNFQGIGGFVYPFDVSDPANPKSLPPWQYLGDGRPHSLTLNSSSFLPGVPEGTLAFVGQNTSYPLRRGWRRAGDRGRHRLSGPPPQSADRDRQHALLAARGSRIDDPGEDQGAPVHRHHRRGGRRERRGRLGGRVCPGGVSFRVSADRRRRRSYEPEDRLEAQAGSERPGELRGAARRDAAGCPGNRAGDQFAGHFGDDQLQ